MKQLLVIVTALSSTLSSLTSFASNYPADYCHATVKVCEDGPGIVAQVSSGCSSGIYIIGYKKQGRLANNPSIDAIVQFHFGNYSTVKSDLRITPDWNNLGFMSSELYLWNIVGRAGSGPLTAISIAFSDAKGAWDSNDGANYHYPVGDRTSSGCYSVKTTENYNSQVPQAAWNIINEAMSR